EGGGEPLQSGLQIGTAGIQPMRQIGLQAEPLGDPWLLMALDGSGADLDPVEGGPLAQLLDVGPEQGAVEAQNRGPPRLPTLPVYLGREMASGALDAAG